MGVNRWFQIQTGQNSTQNLMCSGLEDAYRFLYNHINDQEADQDELLPHRFTITAMDTGFTHTIDLGLLALPVDEGLAVLRRMTEAMETVW